MVVYHSINTVLVEAKNYNAQDGNGIRCLHLGVLIMRVVVQRMVAAAFRLSFLLRCSCPLWLLLLLVVFPGFADASTAYDSATVLWLLGRLCFFPVLHNPGVCF